MATLNEMIAQGAQFNVPDPTAQYNKLAQMQRYQQENELAKMQMEEYGRARQESNALRQFLPGLNESNRSQLLGYGAAGQSVYKTLGEDETQRRLAEQAKSQAAVNRSNEVKNAVAQTRNAVAGIDPNDSESYMALRTSVLNQYPELAPYMPNTWNGNVQQRLLVTADSVLEGQKPEPGFTLSAGQTRFPRGYTGIATAPAAAAAAAVPPSVSEYQFAKTADGGSFIGTYQDFVKAKADATRAPAPVAAPQALPASVQEYEFAKTENGGSFVGTYQDFVKAKADAARAPAPVVAPQALPASVLEYNFAKTPEGGGFVGTYQDFVQSKAEAGRAPVPITAPPAKVAEYEFAKTPAGGSYKGTYQQFLNLGKSEGGTADRAPRTQQVTLSDGTLGIVNMDTGVITRSTVGGASVKGKPSAFAEKAAAQKLQMGKDLTQAITELTDATKDGGLIDQSTGSGAGRLVDLAAGFGGKAMPGAIAIGKLQPIADIALKMVPRFEGPQSDKDTTSYKQAAGQLADPSLPTKIRKEAGKTVLRLMKARKEQFGTVDMVAEGVAPAPAAAGGVVDFGSLR